MHLMKSHKSFLPMVHVDDGRWLVSDGVNIGSSDVLGSWTSIEFIMLNSKLEWLLFCESSIPWFFSLNEFSFPLILLPFYTNPTNNRSRNENSFFFSFVYIESLFSFFSCLVWCFNVFSDFSLFLCYSSFLFLSQILLIVLRLSRNKSNVVNRFSM